MPKKTQTSRRRKAKPKKTGFIVSMKQQNNLVLLAAVLILLTGGLFFTGDGITSWASTVDGRAQVNVTTQASISIPSSVIDFGTCTPGASGLNVSSSNLTAPSECTATNTTYPSWLRVKNIGNVNVSITVDATHTSNRTADSGAATDKFVYGARPAPGEFRFTVTNRSATLGCEGDLATNGTHFDAWGGPQNACTSLGYVGSHEFNVSIQIFIPVDMPATDRNATLQFTATETS